MRAASRLIPILALILIAAPAWAAGGLFEAASADAAADALAARLTEPTIDRARAVRVDATRITADARTLRLNLFDDVDVTARLTRFERRADGATWFGAVDGVSGGRAVVSIENDHVAANIATPDGPVQVRPLEGGLHAVYRIRQDRFAECGAEVEVEPPAGWSPPVAADEEGADDGSVIDVLVVYTPAAAAQSGDIEAEIRLAVDETNDTYAAGDIGQRLRLAGTAEIAYTESGDLATDLSRLKLSADRYMDEVHDLRDQTCADVVSLWIGSGNACGMAYLMTQTGSYFASSAFSVVTRSCATGYYSFGHEIGHNMAARHDRYVDDRDAPYTHSHGYVSVENGWRTIMAYNNACADAGTTCTRLGRWSNPDQDIDGVPLGIPDGEPDAADNALTLDLTAETVANFRDSALCEGRTPTVEFASEPFGDRASGTIRATAYAADLPDGSADSEADAQGGVDPDDLIAGCGVTESNDPGWEILLVSCFVYLTVRRRWRAWGRARR